MNKFNVATLKIQNLNQSTMMAAMMSSLLKNDLKKSLVKTYPRDLSDMLAHASGKTMRKVIKDGRRELSIHKSASIINDATGVALMIENSGDRSISSGFITNVRIAKSIPSAIPVTIPKRTRQSEEIRIT